MTPQAMDQLKAVIHKHWGFDTFRPLQEQAMQAEMDGRDSVVVMPTGGGKSLCYQAPPLVRGDTTIVVSPLISLMKDQVDGLRECGVAAAQLNSSLMQEEQEDVTTALLAGQLRLLFVSPERLVTPMFQQLLQKINVRCFAIDEAHCISHWGHDFRPDYRQLSKLKEQFPTASVHGYTATATQRVRQDIIEQLKLKNAELLVGNFDRPNLTYRVLHRIDTMTQVKETIDRHKGEAGIIYCIRRRDVDDTTAYLRQAGYHALPYHAGLSQDLRRSAQDAFSSEKCDLIVATVAFGMGIDRSNIRYILHTGMPKSIEHYQQETGRAGRDGLEAECTLLYSGEDVVTWKWIINKSASDPEVDPAFLPQMMKHLDDMARYAQASVCRHRSLVKYFGQEYKNPSCQACDVCLGDNIPVPDGQTIAQKILSCVARMKERFGVVQTSAVLHGEMIERVTKYEHEKLSTFGLLKDYDAKLIRNWIDQLLGQDVLVKEGDEYPILKLNPASWEVMRGKHEVRLFQPLTRKEAKKSRADEVSWEGVDRPLFDDLRKLRRSLAEDKGLPPYVVFGDHTLRELARIRPSSIEKMRYVYGIGEQKLREYGDDFFEIIETHCADRQLSRDVKQFVPRPAAPAPKPSAKSSPVKELAYKLFAEGAAIDDVIHQTARSRGTVSDYLCEFIRSMRPKNIAQWVAPDVYLQVMNAAKKVGTETLKPIFLELEEKVPYESIRVVLAHLET